MGGPMYSFDMFDKKVNDVMVKHIPLKMLNKEDFLIQAQPCISPSIINRM